MTVLISEPAVSLGCHSQRHRAPRSDRVRCSRSATEQLDEQRRISARHARRRPLPGSGRFRRDGESERSRRPAACRRQFADAASGLAPSIRGALEMHGGWRLASRRAIVPDAGPQPSGFCLALPRQQHRHRRAVGVQLVGAHQVRAQPLDQCTLAGLAINPTAVRIKRRNQPATVPLPLPSSVFTPATGGHRRSDLQTAALAAFTRRFRGACRSAPPNPTGTKNPAVTRGHLKLPALLAAT